MNAFPGFADIVILLLVGVVLALIIRSMARKRVKGCDGDCSCCGHSCSSTRIELTKDQKEKLCACCESKQS